MRTLNCEELQIEIVLIYILIYRVIILTSKLLESGTIDFSNLNRDEEVVTGTHMNPSYCNSKLANAYFGAELAKRTKGTGICVYMVCPGFSYTRLFRNVNRSWFHYIIFLPIALLYLRTANQVSLLHYVCVRTCVL